MEVLKIDDRAARLPYRRPSARLFPWDHQLI